MTLGIFIGATLVSLAWNWVLYWQKQGLECELNYYRQPRSEPEVEQAKREKVAA